MITNTGIICKRGITLDASSVDNASKYGTIAIVKKIPDMIALIRIGNVGMVTPTKGMIIIIGRTPKNLIIVVNAKEFVMCLSLKILSITLTPVHRKGAAIAKITHIILGLLRQALLSLK